MPVNKNALIRYKTIDEQIRNQYHPYPSMKDLILAIKDKLMYEVSVSQVQKDIRAMKKDDALGYHAPIRFKKSTGGYYYKDPEYTISRVPLNESEMESLDFAAAILGQFSGSKVSALFSQAYEKLSASIYAKKGEIENKRKTTIMPEAAPMFRGSDHIELLLHCISERIPISFNHYSYSKLKFCSHIVYPYFLKEYRNRWYLYGYSETRKEARIFGLDRIFDLVKLKKKYVPCKDEDFVSLFKDSIGVSPIKGKRSCKIKILISRDIANYFKALPFHESQIITRNRESGAIEIEIYVTPTLELKREILSYGQNAVVLSPQWLRNSIMEEFHFSKHNYLNHSISVKSRKHEIKNK